MTDRATLEQEKINKAKWAESLKGNPLLAEVFTALKAAYFEKLIKIKKDSTDNYLLELSDVHESMQNLIKIEAYIDRCIGAGKVVLNNQNKPDIDV